MTRLTLPRLTVHRARAHAIVLAGTLWVLALVSTFGGSGLHSLAGPLNGGDFVYFYTVGHLSQPDRIAEAYNAQAVHTAQAYLVPEAAANSFVSAYPPQIGLIVRPLTVLPYRWAALAWALVGIALYAAIVRRATSTWLGDRTLVFAAAAGFPPFWSCILFGQTTILILAICLVAWIALERQHHFLAGLVLGLLAIKPQFGIPFAVVVMARRDWRMLAGAIASIGVQVAVVAALLGWHAFTAFASYLPFVVRHADQMEPTPFQNHSIRALTRLLPPPLGTLAWLLAAGIVLWQTARAWTSDAPLEIRFGLAMVAAVLVNPHLIVYDATLLALPLLWFGGWYLRRDVPRDAQWYGYIVYGLFITLLIPTAATIRVQASVLLMLWLFWSMQQHARQYACVAQESTSDRYNGDPVHGVA